MAALSLRTDQVEDARWLADRLDRHRAALLASDTGTGKTAVAIETARRRRARRILVLLPNIAMVSWPRDLAKWDDRKLPVFRVGRDGDLVPQNFAGWALINYERIVNRQAALLDSIMRQPWDLGVIDECHLISNPDSQRVQLLYGRKPRLIDCMRRVLALSGTPMRSSPADLHAHCQVLFPEVIDGMTRKQFRERYCVIETRRLPNRMTIEVVTGGKNEDELRRRIAPVMRQRRREDVLMLTLLTIHANFIETGPDAATALEHLAATMGLNLALDDTALEARIDFRNPALTHLLQAAALQRVPDIIALVRDLVGSDSILGRGRSRKVIVPAHHQHVMDAFEHGFMNEGIGVVALRGGQTLAQRQHYVDQFQNNPSIEVAVCQLQVAATAISLTRATDVVFAEMSWSASDNAQAVARAYRLGQVDPVVVQVMCGTTTVELAQARIVANRLESIVRIAPDSISIDLACALREGVEEEENRNDWMRAAE
jgi:SNF2 family DNA or RNA helicase